jgi:hypothetical protein
MDIQNPTGSYQSEFQIQYKLLIRTLSYLSLHPSLVDSFSNKIMSAWDVKLNTCDRFSKHEICWSSGRTEGLP